MTPLIDSLGAWNWFILGGLLFVIELLAPGASMLWLGLAAILVGVISFTVDLTWQTQCIVFAILSIISVALWWRFGRRVREEPSEQPFLNRRTQGFVGRVLTLEKPIEGGAGTVKIDDTIWRVMGPDCPAGSRVKVARADGVTLFVDRAEA